MCLMVWHRYHNDETYSMIRSLRGYPIIKGTRGQKGIDEQQYADIIVRLSTLLRFASEIKGNGYKSVGGYG